MTDKEVGEIWSPSHDREGCSVCDLIRKLVEERAELTYRRQGGKFSYVTLSDKERAYWRDSALKDFGINPEEYSDS